MVAAGLSVPLALALLLCSAPARADEPATCQGGDPASCSGVGGSSLLQSKASRSKVAILSNDRGTARVGGELRDGSGPGRLRSARRHRLRGDRELKDVTRLPRNLDTSSGRNRTSLLALGIGTKSGSATAIAPYPEEIQAFLARHNLYRCMHGAPPVTWSVDMAADAYAYVSSLSVSDSEEPEHSDSFHLAPPAGPAAENIAWAHGYYIQPEDAVDSWYWEVKDCETGGPESFTDGCALGKEVECPDLPDCPCEGRHQTGHFTAMIWDTATEIGCAYNDGLPIIVICRYKAGDTLSSLTPNTDMEHGNFVDHVRTKEALANECWATTQPPPPALPSTPDAGANAARYVRFWPQTWFRYITMRAAVLVGDDLSLQNPPEVARSYSSVKAFDSHFFGASDDGHPGSNKGRSMVNQAARHGWTARQNSVGEWMQIDLGADMDVRGVLLQGKPTTPVGCYALPDDYTLYYVSSLKIQTATSDDPSNFVWRDGGKVYNSTEAQDGAYLKILFDDLAPTPAPTPAPPTPPPTPAPTPDCSSAVETLEGDGASYRGCQTKTSMGYTCQSWFSQTPHPHSTTHENYPEAGLSENYCRNPDGSATIWCYTTDSYVVSDYCYALDEPNPGPGGGMWGPAVGGGGGTTTSIGGGGGTTTSIGGGGGTTTAAGGCMGDATAFDAGYGGCEAYGTYNFDYCHSDSDHATGLLAAQVCPQCQECGTQGEGGGGGGGGGGGSSKAACVGEATSFDAGYGGCQTYAFENNDYCDFDIDQGHLAQDVCWECGKCEVCSEC